MTTMTANSIKKIVLDLLPLEKPDTVLDSLGQYWRRTKADGDTRLGEYSTARTDVSTYEMDLILDWCKKRQNKSAQTPPSVSKPKTTTHNPNSQPSIPNFDRERAKLVAQHQLEMAVAIEEAVAKATEEERKYAAQNLQLILSNERAKLKAEFQDSLNKLVEERVEKALESEKEKRHLAVKAELSTEKMTLTESFNEKLAIQLAIQQESLLNSFEEEKIQLTKAFEAEKKVLDEAIENSKKYAQKWENIEKGSKKELFLRRLNFAYIIVACLVIVQGVEAALFTQLAYKDAGYTGWWVQIVGGILCVGFQGIALFLTVNRKKVIQGVQIGTDEYGNPIYKKNAKGEIELEHFYDMTTMKVLCAIDFLINCFVLFGQSSVQVDEYFKIARLICFSLITPLGIYFTSEVLLAILDKREKQLS